MDCMGLLCIILHVDYVFRWNEWNIAHIADHGIAVPEAEDVVTHACQPWPEPIGDGKWRVWGQTAKGRYMQVIYVFDPPPLVYVIHACDLSQSENRRYRRRRK